MQPAFDLQNLNKRLDTLDAKGPLSRGHQTSWALCQAINSFLLDVKGNATNGTIATSGYRLGEDWAEADRATYEGHIDTATTKIVEAMAELKALVKA